MTDMDFLPLPWVGSDPLSPSQSVAVVAKPRRRIAPRRREWKAARPSVLTSDWLTWARPIDGDIRYSLRTLRSRAREECQNNDHFKHFLRLVKMNVIGRSGIAYQSKAVNRAGNPDEPLRAALEDAWRRWGRRDVCDVTGMLSWRSQLRVLMETAPRDGEILLRFVHGFDNGFDLALQAIDPERLDVDHNERFSDGRQVIMGVEVNRYRRPIAYHFNADNLSPDVGYGYQRGQRERVPAEEVLHWYLPEWVAQTRGIPWFSTALFRAHMLSGYEDAEVVASRASSSKMGFYQRDLDADDLKGDDEDEQGNPITDFRPGEMEILPLGWKFEGWDPQHPTTAFPEFVKTMLRGISSGLGADYNTLSNDLEGVNYTSLRHGSLTARDVWMMLQDEVIEGIVERVHRVWVPSALLSGQIVVKGRAVSIEREEDCLAASWQPRRWPWVDPEKEAKAHGQEYALNTRSIASIIRERGEDPEEVFQEIAREREMFTSLGLPIPQPRLAGQPGAPAQEETEDAAEP